MTSYGADATDRRCDDRPWHSVRAAIAGDASMALYERAHPVDADSCGPPTL